MSMQQIDPVQQSDLLQTELLPTILKHAIEFHPEDRNAALGQLPESCGVFALFPEDSAEGVKAEPYLAKASHLRRRLQRFLSPRAVAIPASATGSAHSPHRVYRDWFRLCF